MSRAMPNVLLVTVDSLRADAVYDDNVPTPNIDELAAESRVYTQAFAQGPFTTFSVPSLFTSRYPSSLPYVELSEGVVGVHAAESTSLPEVFQDAGYATAGFHSNPLLSYLFGFEQGFDLFEARLPFSDLEVLSGRTKILADKLFRIIRKHAYLPGQKLNQRVINWLDQRPADQPFFLWVHYMDAHGPYQSKSGNAYLNKYRGEKIWRKAVSRPDKITEQERKRLRSLYHEEVEYTDRCIGELLDRLRDAGVFEETVCVLTSDHGEQFGEHGTYSHPHQLYDELIHVPLLVADNSDRQGTVDDMVELLDVAPTLVERTGLSQPDSFVGQPIESTAATDDFVVAEADITPEYAGAVRTVQWKYVGRGENDELYDLTADPTEQVDVSEQNRDLLSELSGNLQSHREAHAQGGNGANRFRSIEDSAVEERLKQLGYLE